MENQGENYKEVNKASWNTRVDVHLDSAFYDVSGFVDGKTSLNEIELNMLGDVKGKRILHLQCHFGQDTLSLARMGAHATGVDLSDKAIDAARDLAIKIGQESTFICCDIYDLPEHLNDTFDIVFTSYGTIGWFPDLEKWAAIISKYLKRGGFFVIADFHPVVWMFDNDFEKVGYNYFKDEPIVETEAGTYADTSSEVEITSVTWNHSLSEIMTCLMDQDLVIKEFKEFDYSPYSCFKNVDEFEPGKFRVKHMGNKIPMVYAIKAVKP